MHIIVFGASQEYGASDWKHGGWVRLLKSYVEKKSNFDDLVYNLGVSGDSSSDMLKRFEAEVKARLEKNGKNVVIISAGSNDSYYFDGNKNKTNTSEDEYRKNLEKMIRIGRKYSRGLIFIGIMPVDDKKVQPVPWRTEISYSYDNCKRYNEIMKNTANKNNVPFLDVFSLFSKINYKKLLDDGVHLTSSGHRKIFNIVLRFLEENKIVSK